MSPGIPLRETATAENFDEQAYLRGNPDVAAAVASAAVPSGRVHFEVFGLAEGRQIQHDHEHIAIQKRRKIERIRPLCRTDMHFVETDQCLNFLTKEFSEKFSITETEAVSSNNYDGNVRSLIERHREGLILDCGAGSRPDYHDNVVNFEIADYLSTDIRGVGEQLPFINDSFDAVISMAVLEHVKDPFACAKEIARVLKPGGELICCVPFLQPYHGYPSHYYNMTHQGIRNLFEPYLEITDVTVEQSVLPIWTLTWIVGSWCEGLTGKVRDDFLNRRLSEFVGDPRQLGLLDQAFVTQLSPEKNFELASAFVLFARK